MNQNYTDIIDDLRFLSEPKPLLWLASVMVVVLTILLIHLIWKRKKTANDILMEKEKPEWIYIDALAELEKLKGDLSRERSRQYAMRASAIIRMYIEQRFEIAAPLRSTEEFLTEAQKSEKIEESDRQILGEFLSSCDFLKFARAWAEKDELEKLHTLAVEFVKKTHNHASKNKKMAIVESGASGNKRNFGSTANTNQS